MDYEAVLKTPAAKEFRANSGITEENWKSRQELCAKLSTAIETYGKQKLPRNFYVDIIDPLLSGFIDCATHERTTLSISGCKLMASLPKLFGRELQSHLDRIFTALIRHSASSKTVTSKAAATAVLNHVINVPYNGRMLWHICQVFEEKSPFSKVHATGWLKTLIEEHHTAMHPDRDYESIAHAIRLGLEDGNPDVRSKSRATYWAYHKIDPTGAEVNALNFLNTHLKTALLNDPANPYKKEDKRGAGKENDQPKTKKDIKSDPALAELREQAKQRLREQKAAEQKAAEHKAAQQKVDRSRNFTAVSTASSNMIFNFEQDADDHNKSASSSSKDRVRQDLAGSRQQNDVAVEAEGGRMSKAATRPAGHKKAMSQDNDPASASANPSVKSRGLLSAPVRRPRIVATPINGPQTSRPSSRAGHAGHAPSSQKDQIRRPASVADFKPKVSAPSPRMNTISAAVGKTRSGSTSKPEVKVAPATGSFDYHAPPPRTEDSVRSRELSPMDQSWSPSPMDVDDSGPTIRSTQPSSLSTSELLSAMPVPPQAGHGHGHDVDRGNGPNYVRPPPGLHDSGLHNARRFFDVALKCLAADSLDPLGFRKLRDALTDYDTMLISDEAKYDQLLGQLLSRLHGLEKLEGTEQSKPIHSNPTYNRLTILQMLPALIYSYREWADKWLISSMLSLILYRMTLPCTVGGTDRRIENIGTVIELVVTAAKNPLELVDSVTEALGIGEETIKSLQPDEGPSSVSTFGSYNPYSVRSNIVQPFKDYLLELERSGRNANDVDATWKELILHALTEQDLSGQPVVNKKLPLLFEIGTEILVCLLKRGYQRGEELTPSQKSTLCGLAAHLLANYDTLIRRSVIPYCNVLFDVIADEAAFYSFFPREQDLNLLHYYLSLKPAQIEELPRLGADVPGAPG